MFFDFLMCDDIIKSDWVIIIEEINENFLSSF